MIAFDRRVRQEEKSVNAVGGGWSVERDPGRGRARAVVAGPATVAGLAAKVGLGVGEWPAWLGGAEQGAGVGLADGTEVGWDRLDPHAALAPGQAFTVPNEVLMLWTGDLGRLGRWVVGWESDRRYLRAAGFRVREELIEEADESTAGRVVEMFAEGTEEKSLHGVFITGHGNPWGFGFRRNFAVDYGDVAEALRYRLALVVINACQGGWGRADTRPDGTPVGIRAGGRDLVADSPGARFYGITRTLVPQIFFLANHTRHVRDLVRPGEQGTRAEARGVV
jgi:hypothetical protein